jgi:hypothetical protein
MIINVLDVIGEMKHKMIYVKGAVKNKNKHQ